VTRLDQIGRMPDTAAMSAASARIRASPTGWIDRNLGFEPVPDPI
jgi:hypothetical protein